MQGFGLNIIIMLLLKYTNILIIGFLMNSPDNMQVLKTKNKKTITVKAPWNKSNSSN